MHRPSIWTKSASKSLSGTVMMARCLSWVSIICLWAYLFIIKQCSETIAEIQDIECRKKKFPLSSSFVCECSASFCDTVEGVNDIPSNMVAVITSNKDSLRFAKSQHLFAGQSNVTDPKLVITINSSLEYQSLMGFGGAFTDAATMNILNISSKAQDNLLRSYFSTQGIEYSFGRIPIASCDFSLSEYSYDDVPNDFSMQNFSLASADIQFKIPVIQRSLAMSEREVKLCASPWSAPAWMKTNDRMNGKGQLLGKAGDKCHKTWASYFVRFLEEYKKRNVSIWGLTVENEPSAGAMNNNWQAMYFTPEMERDFIKKDLGPALHQGGFGDIKIMILDDQRIFLPDFPKTVLSDPEAAKYISGIAVHWYSDFFFVSPSLLTDTHKLFPDMFLLNTEASNGYLPDATAVVLGSWERGEAYSHNIIQDFSNWISGWIDWNLALNMQGGPNWAKNEVDSPIIVNAEYDVFYKQPMFYHMGHFSKFIPPGSVRIGLTTSKANSLESLAFKLPDGKTVAVIVLNRMDESRPLSLHDPSSGYVNALVSPRSITTYLWSSPK